MAKEPVTKFDLAAAFKALDEIQIPTPRKGIAANRLDMHETMKRVSKTDLLLEDYYNLQNSEDLTAAQEAREAEVAKAKLARIEKIVDLDAETEEDLLTSYTGKIIIQCPQCMTLFYKKPEDLEYSEDDEDTVNVGEACQHCGNTDGYMVIGKVAEVPEEERANYEATEEPVEDEEASDEEVAEEEPEEDSGEYEEPTEGSEEESDLDLAPIEDAGDDEANEDEEGEAVEESISRKSLVEDTVQPETNNQTQASQASTANTNKSQTNTNSNSQKTNKPAKLTNTQTTTKPGTEAKPVDGKEEVATDDKEQLNEDSSVDDFAKLIQTDEFKRPISDEEVRGYLESASSRNGYILDEAGGFRRAMGNLKSAAKAVFNLKGISEKAKDLAGKYFPDDLDDYSFYVVPYVKTKKVPKTNHQVTAVEAGLPEEMSVRRFPIDKFKEADEYAYQISKNTDKNICEVDVFLAKTSCTAKDFIFGDKLKDENGKLVKITAHPYTFSAYEDGRNIIEKTVEVRWRARSHEMDTAKRAEKAARPSELVDGDGDTRDDTPEETPEETPHDPEGGDTPDRTPKEDDDESGRGGRRIGEPEERDRDKRVPMGDDGDGSSKGSKGKEEPEEHGDAEEPDVKKTRKYKPITTPTLEEDKWNIVYGPRGRQQYARGIDKATAEDIVTNQAIGASFGTQRISKLYKPGNTDYNKPDYVYRNGQPYATEALANFDDLEELNEMALDDKLEESLTNVYKNVKSFNVSKSYITESGALVVKGDITFKSGKTNPVAYRFTEGFRLASGKIVLCGLIEGIANKGSVRIRGSINNGMFLTEAVKYKYLIDDKTLVEGYTGKPKQLKK